MFYQGLDEVHGAVELLRGVRGVLADLPLQHLDNLLAQPAEPRHQGLTTKLITVIVILVVVIITIIISMFIDMYIIYIYIYIYKSSTAAMRCSSVLVGHSPRPRAQAAEAAWTAASAAYNI